MNLNTIKNVVTRGIHTNKLIMQKNSPAIMFGTGIVGVVATTVLASKATLHLDELLVDSEFTRHEINSMIHDDYSDKDRKRDHMVLSVQTAQKVLRLYAPTIAVGTVSILLLTRSHVMLTNRNNALVAAYAALDRGFKEYRQRVTDAYGEEKEYELRHGKLMTEKYSEVTMNKDGEITTKEATQKVRSHPSVYSVYFDEASSSWSRDPEYNKIFLMAQQNYANNILHTRGHLFLNEVYYSLGLPHTKAGAVVGWVRGNGDDFVDFGIFEGGDRARRFVNMDERTILLDFNVDGVIYDKLGK